MFVIVTIRDLFGYRDELCFDDLESAAEHAHLFVIPGGFDVRFHFGGVNMKTEVRTQKVVKVEMTLEEWSEALVDPEALLIKIENADLAVIIEPSGNGKDHGAIKLSRRPKARKAAVHRATRKI